LKLKFGVPLSTSAFKFKLRRYAQVISFTDLLAMHWTSHDPTQGNRQGNDSGTQYRSGRATRPSCASTSFYTVYTLVSVT
jgi:hypothetical protein